MATRDNFVELVDRVGLLCVIIDGGNDHKIVGRTMLQKITYFCRYLGWDVGHYRLHYYGPFSFELTDTIKTAQHAGLITEGDDTPHTFELTKTGRDTMKQFTKNICDSDKLKNTCNLIAKLSTWEKTEIELAATIDFVSGNTPDLKKDDLLDKVGKIKENFSARDIQNAYRMWKKLNIS